MKIRCTQYIASIILVLPEKRGRYVQEKDYLAVSAVKRAAEGEIYNVTLF